MCWSLFFNKFDALKHATLPKERCCTANIMKYLRTPFSFFTEIPLAAFLFTLFSIDLLI